MRTKVYILLIVLGFFFFICLFSIVKWFNNSTERLFDYRYAYVFNSETVIESIQNGDNDVFEKTDPEKFELPKADAEPIIYSNNDFFFISECSLSLSME